MKTLILIRHAKAASYGTIPGDHGRPLADKGHWQTKILAQQLSNAGIKPDLVLLSNSLRTIETWNDLKSKIGPAQVKLEESLYLASCEQIEKQIWLSAAGIDTLAVVGHNPGMAMVTWNLLQAGSGHQRQAEEVLRNEFKTGFAAQFDMRGEKPKLVQLFDPRRGQ